MSTNFEQFTAEIKADLSPAAKAMDEAYEGYYAEELAKLQPIATKAREPKVSESND